MSHAPFRLRRTTLSLEYAQIRIDTGLTLRMRSARREYFPAFLQAFGDLAASDALELLAESPDPERAARLSRGHSLRWL